MRYFLVLLQLVVEDLQVSHPINSIHHDSLLAKFVLQTPLLNRVAAYDCRADLARLLRLLWDHGQHDVLLFDSGWQFYVVEPLVQDQALAGTGVHRV